MGGILPLQSTIETKQTVLLSQALAKDFEKRISKKVWSLHIFCDRKDGKMWCCHSYVRAFFVTIKLRSMN